MDGVQGKGSAGPGDRVMDAELPKTTTEDEPLVDRQSVADNLCYFINGIGQLLMDGTGPYESFKCGLCAGVPGSGPRDTLVDDVIEIGPDGGWRENAQKVAHRFAALNAQGHNIYIQPSRIELTMDGEVYAELPFLWHVGGRKGADQFPMAPVPGSESEILPGRFFRVWPSGGMTDDAIARFMLNMVTRYDCDPVFAGVDALIPAPGAFNYDYQWCSQACYSLTWGGRTPAGERIDILDAFDVPDGVAFQSITTDQLQRESKSIDWLIDGLVEAGGLIQVFGQPGTGKSLIALSMAACVASGTPWQDRKVKQGAVLYVAGEGRDGLIRRLKAWEAENDTAI